MWQYFINDCLNEQTETMGNFGKPMSILRDRVKPIGGGGAGIGVKIMGKRKSQTGSHEILRPR